MGNVILISDSDGKQAAAYGYTPFGKLVSQVGVFEARFLFSSKERDPETGLNFYGYRFANPDLGTWLNRDIILERGGINLYAYLRNAPLSRIDPLGDADGDASSFGGLIVEAFGKSRNVKLTGEALKDLREEVRPYLENHISSYLPKNCDAGFGTTSHTVNFRRWDLWGADEPPPKK